MILQTPRLLLREFTKDDLDAFALIMADPEVMRFSLSGPQSKEVAKHYLEHRIIHHYQTYGYGLWAVVYEGILIGLAGLIAQEIDGEKKIELGYRFHPHYWGKGLATEAGLAILQYAFEVLKLNEVISIIDPLNIRSLRVAERVGMTKWKETTFHGFTVGIYRISRI